MKWKDLQTYARGLDVKLELPQLEVRDVARTLCSWSDARGFGQKCLDHQWDLAQMLQNGLFVGLQWLWKIDEEPRVYPNADGTMFSEYIQGLNDGVVRGVDLPPVDIAIPAGVYQYVHHLVARHHSFNDHVQDVGLPGVVTVVALGDRLRFQAEGEPRLEGHPSRPHRLNMNSGFAFAYLIESAGRKWSSEPNSMYFTEETVRYLALLTLGVDAQEVLTSPAGVRLDCIHEYAGRPDYSVSLAFQKETLACESKLYRTRLFDLAHSNEWNELSGEHHVQVKALRAATNKEAPNG